MGHSLCVGWIKPVVGVDDPLEAIGYVLLGAGESLFAGLADRVALRLARTITFRNGNVLLCFTPDAR